MKRIIEVLSRTRIGTERTFENLTMVPMLGGQVGEPDYLLLDEALQQKLVKIKEKSKEGSVPELKLKNKSDRPVLILDGEELVGAKQNRVMNLSILAPGGKTIEIPVSCVEQGRWRSVSREFSSSPRAHYAMGRMAKMRAVSQSMIAGTGHASDQAQVWADIGQKAATLGAHSPTGAMSDVYEQHLTPIEDYVNAFSAAEGQAGALFAIDGRIVGFDLFDSQVTLRHLLPKLIRSYALDALESKLQRAVRPGTARAVPPLGASVDAFLRDVTMAKGRAFEAIGLGEDIRFHGPGLTGGALAAKDRVIHLSAFRVSDSGEEDEAEGHRAQMARMLRSARARARGRREEA